MNILIVTSVSFCMLYFETVLGFSGQVCNRFPESLLSFYKIKFYVVQKCGNLKGFTAISVESHLALLDCIGGKRFQSSCWLRERFRHI